MQIKMNRKTMKWLKQVQMRHKHEPTHAYEADSRKRENMTSAQHIYPTAEKEKSKKSGRLSRVRPTHTHQML